MTTTCANCGRMFDDSNPQEIEEHDLLCEQDPEAQHSCSLCRLKFAEGKLAMRKMGSGKSTWGMLCQKCCDEIDTKKKAARLRKTLRRNEKTFVQKPQPPKGERKQKLSSLPCWDEADRLSVATGIKVWGFQFDERCPEFAQKLREIAEPLDFDDFASGGVKPAGCVVFYVERDGTGTLWEMLPASSELFREIIETSGPEPGALATIKLQ
jgi:hypothetical protein